MDLQQFCKALPKIELHAHLNGSLSLETMQKLLRSKFIQDGPELDSNYIMDLERYNSLAECFKFFEMVHSLTDRPDAVMMVTLDVIRDFYKDNVIYLELRSTPRSGTGNMTKHQYIMAILSGIQAAKHSCPGMIVKLLISVDRRHVYDVAKVNVDLAISMSKEYPEYIVGVDLSGDPRVGYAHYELMQDCKDAGLKITMHCGEVPNENECIDILNIGPDRLGHCTCIHPSLKGSETMYMMLLESKIPVELCLSSNIKCKTIQSYEQHHFQYLYQAKHPICICTDDKGVFDTTLSQEYEHLGKYFGLRREELKQISLNAVQYSFATAEEKEKLTSAINSFSAN